MKKRLLSILLTACMVLTLLPMAAMAAETTDTFGAFTVTYDGTAPTYTNNTLTLGSGNYTVAMTEGVTQTTDDIIVVSSGAVAHITLNNVNIDVSAKGYTCAFDMTGATLYLTLSGANTLKSGIGMAGLRVPAGASLTITGQSTGSLTATTIDSDGHKPGAGIGGSHSEDCGTVTINGGTVTATGGADSGRGGAGIGGSCNANGAQSGGTVTITGGTVTAKGGARSAGIGGGSNGLGGTGGTVTITGGTVIATGGSLGGAGIGGGSGGAANVVITGGSIKAVAGASGIPAIGTGASGTYQGTLKNANGTNVELYIFTLSGISSATALTALSTTDSLDYTYGTTDMKTDEDGMLYLYLPAGKTGVNATTVAAKTYKNDSFTSNIATLYYGYTVSGTVSAGAIGASVSGLTVNIYASSDTTFSTALCNTTTDESGAYAISGIPNGSYVARVAGVAGSYAASVSDTITVSDGQVSGANVTLTALTTQSIVVKAGSHKISYIVNDPLDVANLVITVTRNDGSTYDKNVTTDMVEGFNSSSFAASRTLTITFDGKTATYTISVNRMDYAGDPAPAPTLISKTNTQVVLDAVTVAGQNVEYGKNTLDNAPAQWQDTTTFTDLTANTTYYFFARVKQTATIEAGGVSTALSVTTKSASATLSNSGVTYSVKDGTVTGLGSTYEYSLNNGATWQTAPITGVTFAAGNVIQVRTRETDDAMPSLPQTLGTIGALAAAPAYTIDFVSEKTTVSVPATVEYNTTSSDAAAWMAGTGAPLMLFPGATYYFRTAATDTALSGNVQTLEIPARPTAPDVSVITISAGEDASHTAITLADTYEYILADALPDISATGTAGIGSASEIAAIGGQHVYIRVKATVSAFASSWTDCGEVQLGVDDIIFTGVGYDIAAGKLTGTTTNMQYSLDGGSVWQDCAAGNTTGLTFIAGTVKVRQKDKPTNEAIVVTLAAPAESGAPTLGSKTYNSVTLTAMTGYEYSRDGGTTWQDSNVFSGLSGSTMYSFLARIKATAETLPGTISASLTATTDSAPSGGSTNSGNRTVSTLSGAPVIVDGKTVNIGTENKTGDATTVTVDQSKLGENIGGAVAGSSVVVPVSENGAATASLVVKNIEDMAQKGMTLTVQTGSTAYNLNTSAIDTAALAAAFPGADMSKVPFDVTIQNSSVSVKGETLVLSPVAFTVTATYNGKTVSVDTFSAYINRVIEITAKQAAKITTAVVVNADGSTRHVPTNVIEKDGRYYAIINSRTNSTYALIQNEVTFADAKGKWYEGKVNEMGSRKIIAGRSASVFDGGASITRAEFAAILIRALGLPVDGTSSFSDVPTTAWYTGVAAMAAQYGLVAGKGENRFDPNVNITRQEAMLMLQRAAALTEFCGTSGALDDFADVDSIASWAVEAAKWGVGSGLIQGADGKLNPTANITRAESAAIILRLLQKAGLVDVRS